MEEKLSREQGNLRPGCEMNPTLHLDVDDSELML